MGIGFLQIELFAADHAVPIGNAQILIKDTNGVAVHSTVTDKNGLTDKIPLNAPDKDHSLDAFGTDPRFAVYDVIVPHMSGFKEVIVRGVQIFDTITSILPIQMHPEIIGDTPEENTDEIIIPPEHGVDMPEASVRASRIGGVYYNTPPYTAMESSLFSERALANEVPIPEYVTVHLGKPNDAARNVRVSFKDYIKNVASSEIFPTWEESALYANIYCQISIILNRVFTSWYRSRGFDFDITNSTQFDQFFVEGRNIFDNISRIVDRIFNVFIRRVGRREPFYAEYCNGTTATCPGLSQWGSQSLALQGYTPMQILRYYYPQDVDLFESNNFMANIETYPGTPLREGSTGEAVRTMQIYLNRISGDFYMPAPGRPDGIFGSSTRASVVRFQEINNLIPDGIIGKSTWYQITKIYSAVKKLAELGSEGIRMGIGTVPPTITIQTGARGEYVVELQFLINFISEFFPTVPYVIQTGVFSEDTKRGVIEFQKEFGLTPDGIVGPTTWRRLYDVYHSIVESGVVPPDQNIPTIPPFPGVPLRVGSQGSNVLLMQNYLNSIARYYPSIPTIAADGAFGPATQAAVIAFQRQFNLTPDGVIGEITWYKIIEVYNDLPTTGTQPQFPGTPLQIGSRGSDVTLMQNYLRAISRVFPVIPTLTADGVFGAGTQASVIAFQRFFNLTPDGVIGRNTWDKIVSVFSSLPDTATPVYPGASLRVGSRGNDVIIMQKYLNSIALRYPAIPTITADGVFGPATERAVIAFQQQFGLAPDGIIGRNTWNQIVSVYNLGIMNV